MLMVLHYVCLLLGAILGMVISVQVGVYLALEFDLPDMLNDMVFLIVMTVSVTVWYFFVDFMETKYGTEQGLRMSFMVLLLYVVLSWVHKVRQKSFRSDESVE